MASVKSQHASNTLYNHSSSESTQHNSTFHPLNNSSTSLFTTITQIKNSLLENQDNISLLTQLAMQLQNRNT
ncbi:hypothetical protein RhiirA1_483033 [Rhizophagus irregularis]|uniref:Uncharacterized protein n=1 Tax=Rhizophagus irregularis TaxID=588596 RepID=A0A2N0QL41_9GLOM|nr:hypothetical protein RhiirA1_483033 [Rhizophagus irregularis]